MARSAARERSSKRAGQLSLDRFQAIRPPATSIRAARGPNPAPNVAGSIPGSDTPSVLTWPEQVDQFLRTKTEETRVGEGWIR